jgi:CHAT domain-containing protein/Tfp pilus assembly protein PilF
MHSFLRSSITRVLGWRPLRCAWLLVPLALVPCQDRQTGRAQAEYDHAYQHFLHGELLLSQQEATSAADRYEGNDSAWAVKFRRLEVRCLIYRSLNADAEKIVSHFPIAAGDTEGQIWKLVSEGYFAYVKTDLTTADQKLALAESLCTKADFPDCGDALQVQGEVDWWRGQNDKAWQHLLQALALARRHRDRWLEAEIEGTLGVASFSHQRLDETVDWLSSSYRHQVELGAGSHALAATLNLGLAYMTLGDREKAKELVTEGERLAAGSSSADAKVSVLMFWGDFYAGDEEPERAVAYFRKALELYQANPSAPQASVCLELLAEAELNGGDVADAADHFHQAFAPRFQRHTNYEREDLFLGRLAAARHKDKEAVSILYPIVVRETVLRSTRMSAGLELARIFERQGRYREAEQRYRTALGLFETTRKEVVHEESALSLAVLVRPIYEGYIDLLVRQGRIKDALAVADSSRAQTLAHGLGVAAEKFSFRHTGWNPRQIAKKADATLLFYSLGKHRSYLWVIDEHRIKLVRLQAAAEVGARVDRFRKVLERRQDPLQANSSYWQDGRALYDQLVAPAARRIKPNGRVMIFADGALSQLNFETLLAPGPPPGRTQAGSRTTVPAQGMGNAHFWIEDAVLASAPSLSLLAAAKPDGGAQGKLLLVGDAVSPSSEYPPLALAGMEMNLVQRHFSAERRTVLNHDRATPAAYLGSSPAQFAYLHFVAHGTASTTAPLESAIILSRDGGGSTYQQSPFKLYARDIVRHPVDARLVTISACYGSGARTYTGEGLVGLAWAFLRAGAHNVIGALWEVSDESTPRLMDGLYTGLDAGLDPATALRKSKLALLHSNSSYRAPFFWAGFQLYTGH